MKNILLLSAFLTTLLFACMCENVISELDKAELLLQTKPDSCLAIMNSLNTNSLKTNKERARYALLMSAALDKNYIDVYSDSLITIATHYYSIRNDPRRKMMANYYLGQIQNRLGEFPSAIITLEKAEKDALVLEDHLYAGLIFRTKGEVFNQTNNFSSSLSCLQEAIRHFQYLENPEYAYYATLGLAICFINMQDYDSAIRALDRLELDNIPESLQLLCILQRANIIVECEGVQEDAVSLYKRIPKSYMSPLCYGRYALALESTGQRDSADSRFTNAYSLCQDQADSASIDFLQAKVLHLRGNDSEAYRLTRKAAFVQDSLTQVLLQQSVSNAQRDYYKAESLLQEERAKRLRERNRLGAAVAMLALALISGVSLSYRKRKEEEIKEQMLNLSFAQSELHRAEQTNASLLGSLFSEKLNHLDKLSLNYISADSDKERIAALREFKERIAAMRTDEDLFVSLEKDLDRYCDGAISKLRKQVPSIKGENLKLITLFFAGLPYSTVQLVMNRVSVESLKMARSRFRKEIMATNAPDETLFIKLLEMNRKSN